MAVNDYIGAIESMPFAATLNGSCSTAAGTVRKDVTFSGFDTQPTHIMPGMTIHVQFSNSNTATNPTLKFGGISTALPIYRYGTARVGTTAETSWPAGAIVSLTYSGTTGSDGGWVIDGYRDGASYSVFDNTTDGLVPAPIDFASTVAGGLLSNNGVWGRLGFSAESSSGSSVTFTPVFVNTEDTSVLGNIGSVEFSLTIGSATSTNAGLLSSTLYSKLVGIDDGAEVNQNAFSNITVGSTTIAAEAKTDTLTLTAGSNVTLTPNATSDSVTIAATDTTYSQGTGISISGTTINHSNSVTAGTAGSSSASSGATVSVPYVTYDAQGHVTASGTHTHTIGSLAASAVTSGTFAAARIPTATGSAKGGSTLYDSWDDTKTTSSGYSATPAAVASALATAKQYTDDAVASGASFKGTLGTGTATDTHWTETSIKAADYKAGWYWVVDTAGTYLGLTLEEGDMVYAVSAKGSAYAASDFTAIQNNMTSITDAEIDTIVDAA